MGEAMTVIGVFAGIAAAQRVEMLLHEFGVARERLTTRIRVTAPAAVVDEPTPAVAADLVDEDEALRWDDAVRCGAAVVRVHVDSSFDADTVEALMRSHGAFRTSRD